MIHLSSDIKRYRDRIDNLNRTVFPENERREFDALVRDKGQNCDFFAIEHHDEFLGFAVVLYTDVIAHLIYYAIEPSHQGQGLGSQALSALINHYSKPVIADIEEPKPFIANYSDRMRRKQFYLNSGFIETSIKYNWRDEDNIILSTQSGLVGEYFTEFWLTIAQRYDEISIY